MNDILAPIFAVFLCELFDMKYIAFENRYIKMKSQITKEFLFPAEADSYHCLLQFMSELKFNYMENFKGIRENFDLIEGKIKALDPELYQHFQKKEIIMLHFGFRWSFCLLLREFPIYISIKLIDSYLIADVPINDMCNYMIISILL